MKFTKQILPLVLITIVLVISGANVSAQTKAKPKTVADYFMLLPQKYLSILEYYKNRRAAIETLDVKNGYLDVKAKVWDGETGDAEIALFRQSNGAATIAVAETNCGMDDCAGSLTLLEYDGKKWTDITKNVMPEITGKMLNDAFDRIKTAQDDALGDGETLKKYFLLPRQGTSIVVALGGLTASSSQPLFYLKWNGARFVFSETK